MAAESSPWAKASAKARACFSFGRDSPASRKASSPSAKSPSGVSARGSAASRPQIAVAAWLEIICPQRLLSSPGNPPSRRRQGKGPASSGIAANAGSSRAKAARASLAQPGASSANRAGGFAYMSWLYRPSGCEARMRPGADAGAHHRNSPRVVSGQVGRRSDTYGRGDQRLLAKGARHGKVQQKATGAASDMFRNIGR
jgi:hypothetical protein